jgi:hypothetical protein
MTRPVLAWAGMVGAVLLLVGSLVGAWVHVRSASQRLVSGTHLVLPDDLASSLREGDAAGCTLGGSACRIERVLDGQGRSVTAILMKTPSGSVVEPMSRGEERGRSVTDLKIGDSYALRVGIVPRWAALLAALGMFLLVISLPFLLFGHGSAASSPGAWTALLSEPGGGLSLARVQLLIWFVPALLAYAAVSIPTLTFAPIDATLAVLLGMSGATTALGAVANPALRSPPLGIVTLPPRTPFPSMSGPAPTLASGGDPPQLADLVEDWEGRGDFSRYQYLLLAIVGAVILCAGFAINLNFPTLPNEFVALIGASQATYLGTKAVKTARQDSASAARGSA